MGPSAPYGDGGEASFTNGGEQKTEECANQFLSHIFFSLIKECDNAKIFYKFNGDGGKISFLQKTNKK